MAFVLEIGKRYRNRQGETVKIVNKVSALTHRYEGSDGEFYRYNGRMGFFRDHVLDLVEETNDDSNMRPSSWIRVFDAMFNNKKAA